MKAKAITTAVAAMLLAAGNAWGVVQYTVTKLDTSGTRICIPTAINNRGQVVGYTQVNQGKDRAFIWDAVNGFRDLGILGNGTSWANAINDMGEVVGDASSTNGSDAFIWDKDNGMRSIGSLNPVKTVANWSYAYGINNAGQVTGGSWTGAKYHPYIWTSGVGMQDITPSSSTQATGKAINSQGTVAGYSFLPAYKAFVWDSVNGSRQLGDPTGEGTFALGINDVGTVVGWLFRDNGVRNAFVWNASDGVQALGGLGGLRSDSWAFSINKNGTIVGSVNDVNGIGHAVIWDGGSLLDLNSLIPSGLDLRIWTATGINDSGSIVASSFNASGQWEGLLLTPIPEPATLSLLALGGLAVMRRRRLRR